MIVGAHESVAGGLQRAWGFAAEDGCDALQIFTKTANQWREPTITPDLVRAWKDARAASRRPDAPVQSHDSYLINLCAQDDMLRERSRQSLLAEALRCEALGVEHVVLHPGAHVGAGIDAGVAFAAENLAWVLGQTRGAKVKLLVENTAGQGTVIASRFEEIGAILRGAGEIEPTEAHRLAVCFDTCHAFAAGYDIATPAGFDAAFAELDRHVGVEKIAALHLNDSVKGVGCHLDRHARLGKGMLGLWAFWRLMNEPRLRDTVAVLETPHDGDDRCYREQLAQLRALQGAPEPAPPEPVFALDAPAPKKATRKAPTKRPKTEA